MTITIYQTGGLLGNEAVLCRLIDTGNLTEEKVSRIDRLIDESNLFTLPYEVPFHVGSGKDVDASYIMKVIKKEKTHAIKYSVLLVIEPTDGYRSLADLHCYLLSL